MPHLKWGAASWNPYCTFDVVAFCPLPLKSELQILCSSKEKACLNFFLLKRPLLQYCIMHSSVCTNGCFCRFSLTSWPGLQPERPVLSRSDATPPWQAWIQLWPMYSSLFWPKTITAGWTRWQANLYCIFLLISNLQMKISSPWLSPNEWGEQKDIQDTKWNNRGVVRMAARSLLFFS